MARLQGLAEQAGGCGAQLHEGVLALGRAVQGELVQRLAVALELEHEQEMERQAHRAAAQEAEGRVQALQGELQILREESVVRNARICSLEGALEVGPCTLSSVQGASWRHVYRRSSSRRHRPHTSSSCRPRCVWGG